MSKKPRSHTRRFVQSAWALLSFQFIASVGAVGVTAWAAFHVQRVTAGIENSTPLVADPAPARAVGQEAGAAPAPALLMRMSSLSNQHRKHNNLLQIPTRRRPRAANKGAAVISVSGEPESRSKSRRRAGPRSGRHGGQ